MKIYKYILLALPFFAASCSGIVSHENEVMTRLDRVLVGYEQEDSLGRVAVREKYGDIINTWLSVVGVPDSVDAHQRILRYSGSRPVKVFMPDVESRFMCADSINVVLSRLKDKISCLLPGVKFPRVYAVVSQYRQSVILSDSIMFVGLNHYLGSDYAGYDYYEPYQRNVKTPVHLPYDVSEAFIINSFPFVTNENTTVLNAILFEGAVVYAVMNLLPDADLSKALGYSDNQLTWVVDNEESIWNALITRSLLYSTSSIDAERLLRPAPATTLLHQECPGRAGRYIGYKIVKSWVENNGDVSLGELLSPSFYDAPGSLVDSKYQP